MAQPTGKGGGGPLVGPNAQLFPKMHFEGPPNGPTKLNEFSLGSETSHRFGHWACIFAFLYISFSNIMCRIWFRWFHFHVQPMFNIKCWMWISLSLKDASFPLRCLPMFTWRKLLLGSKQLTYLASPHPLQKRKIWKLQIRLRRWELVN